MPSSFSHCPLWLIPNSTRLLDVQARTCILHKIPQNPAAEIRSYRPVRTSSLCAIHPIFCATPINSY